MKRNFFLSILCFAFALGFNQAYATEVSECVELVDGEIYSHDLNTPYLDNCYKVENNYKSAISISIMFLDGLKGNLLVKQHSPSTMVVVQEEAEYPAGHRTVVFS